jgi:hypothetical protein
MIKVDGLWKGLGLTGLAEFVMGLIHPILKHGAAKALRPSGKESGK